MFSFLTKLYDCSLGSLYNSLYSDMDGVTVFQPLAVRPKPRKMRTAISDGNVDKEMQASFLPVINRRYLFPCLLYLFHLLDTLYLMLFPNDTASSGTIGRKLLPASLAEQADSFFIEIVLMVLAVAVQFLLHNMETFQEKFRMTAVVNPNGRLKEMIQNGKVLPKLEGEAIFKLHRQAEKICKLLSCLVLHFAYPFYNLNLALNWTGTFGDVKACAWICLAIPYITMNLYVAVCCFIFNCRYLRLRQRHQMASLRALIGQSWRELELLKKRRNRGLPGTSPTIVAFFWSSWYQFGKVNLHLNVLRHQITGYSLFWSRYLSVYFTGLICLVTYMAFLLLKLDATTNALAIAFIAYFAFLLLSFLLWITLECAVLVYNTKEILKLQRTFTVHTSLIGKMPRFAAMKFDQIEADSPSIRRVGFKLLDSVQINSKTFELLFFYISSLFMKIVEHQI